MKILNVGELRRRIAHLPDQAPVLVPASDHSYRPASVESGHARFCAIGGWSEDDGDESVANELGKRYGVLIIT